MIGALGKQLQSKAVDFFDMRAPCAFCIIQELYRGAMFVRTDFCHPVRLLQGKGL